MFEPAVWQSKLKAIEEAGLKRDTFTLDSPQGRQVSIAGESFLNFASNDYLGLANHPQVAEAARSAITNFGVGSGASHKVCGHSREHDLLQAELAEFTGRDKALLFSTGYMANLAVISALCSSKSLVLQDKLNHASLLDGGKLAGARSQRFLHADISSLNTTYARLTAKTAFDQTLVVTDGVFSMDGDVAPLLELSHFCDANNALLMVDDAHGLGVLGESGRGSVDAAGLSQEACPLYVGTFGKAVGTQGAFVAGPKVLIDYIEQVARPLIYTTAMPPALAAASRRSIQLLASDEGLLLRTRLFDNIAYFRSGCQDLGFNLLESNTAIQCILVGSNSAVMRLAAFLRSRRLVVGAIRPPTVPKGTARLRVTLSAAHTTKDIDCLLAALSDSIPVIDGDKASPEEGVDV